MLQKHVNKALLRRIIINGSIVLFLSFAFVLFRGEKVTSAPSINYQAYPPPEDPPLQPTVAVQPIQPYPAPGYEAPTSVPSEIQTRSLNAESMEKQFQGIPHTTMAVMRTSITAHLKNIQNMADSSKSDINTLPIDVPLDYPQGLEAYQSSKQLAQIYSPQSPLNVPAQILNLDTSFSPKINQQSLIYYSVSYEAIQQPGVPPDSHIAIGPTDLVAVVNFQITIYDKSNPGNLLAQYTFANWYNGLILADTSVFDSRIIFDPWNSRFIMIAVGKNTRTQQSQFLVSVSPQSSALGNWIMYSFDASTNGGNPTSNWADRPDIGIDGDNLYITANMYDFQTTSFQYAKIRGLILSELYSGNISHYIDAWDLHNTDGAKASIVQPANRCDTKGGMFFVNAGSSGNLTLWLFTNPFSAPSLTKTNISVQSFSTPPNAQQPGTQTLLSTIDVRILQAQYRAGGIWAVHHISYDFGTGPRSVIRLYEIKADGSGLWNQITFGNPDYFYFFPSFTTDLGGNLIVAFSITSRTDLNPPLYASIAYTGRLFQDPPNTVRNNTILIKSGEGSYENGNPTRWGDYSGTALDPSDKTTEWIFNQYAKSGNTISTWIATTTYFTNRIYLPITLNQ